MKKLFRRLSCLLVPLLLMGCSATKFVPDGSYMLDDVRLTTDNKKVSSMQLKGYVRQRSNSRWFSLLKVPLAPYALSGRDTTERFNRFLQRIGEAPVVLDTTLASRSARDIETAVHNMGYLDATVDTKIKTKRRKAKITYAVNTGEVFRVQNIHYQIDDKVLEPIILADSTRSLLKRGMAFDLTTLDNERVRLNAELQNQGYYKFNKEYITYEADTTQQGSHSVDLTCNVALFRQTAADSATLHRKYYIDNVRFISDADVPVEQLGSLDSLTYNNYSIFYKNKLRMRPKVYVHNTFVEPKSLFRERDVQNTYNNLGALRALKYSSIRMVEEFPDSNQLNCYVVVNSNKAHSIGAELEGTNSAGDLGAAASLTFQNRNIFRGSEIFSFKLRGAFEAITGLEGYNDQNYFEISAEVGLTFPTIEIPFIKKEFRKTLKASSEISFMYDSQNRPEFHRRVLTGVWRYRWNVHNHKVQHRVDMLDLNYVFMPWISDTFRKEYLENESTKNSILRYNYENLFIMKLGYNYSYNSLGNNLTTSLYGTNAYAFRFNVETSGNLLYGSSQLFRAKRNSENAYTLFNIAYAQYVKGDVDFSKSFLIDQRNSVAFHAGLGIAYPYGNSTILPYEKRYFSGGANSVRGWAVRELGPGTYTGGNGKIDFINQTGDIKLDLNLEYRTYLFWKLNGAVFVDAGNIWTIRNYADQPGGQFNFKTFWKQIAVAYGLGLRFNFDYFILRLDGGMRAIDPAYSDKRGHYPIFYPKFSRDFTFHFAVGLPF